MALQEHGVALERRLARLESRFFAHYGNASLARQERWFRAEGLLSQTWQAWGHFCREVIMESCLGTVAQGGRVIAKAQPAWVDQERVSYEALCAARSQRIQPNRRLNSLRQEITWGDTDKLTVVVQTLSPSNRAELLAGFGGSLVGPKHLQLVRNAAAHMNRENSAEVNRLRAFYFGSTLNHPTDLAEWSHIQSRDPAYIAWLTDIRQIAATCIQ